MICARDAQQADEMLSFLAYVLTDAGSDSERGLDIIRKMTGEQIIDGITAYRDRSYESVKAAYPAKDAA